MFVADPCLLILASSPCSLMCDRKALECGTTTLLIDEGTGRHIWLVVALLCCLDSDGHFGLYSFIQTHVLRTS